MKTLTVLVLSILCQSIAFAQTSSDDGTIHAMIRSCDSPYLGNFEDCVTPGKTCPPGYTPRSANYCSHSTDVEIQWHRCGTTCESLYRGR